MAWETVAAGGAGRGGNYGEAWGKVPCVSVGKTGMTFNSIAVEAFGLKRGNYVRVLVDRQRRLLGFKQCVNGEDLVGAFKITPAAHGKRVRTVTFHIHCNFPGKNFPDCIGHAYRAHLNAGERVIEVELSTTNKA